MAQEQAAEPAAAGFGKLTKVGDAMIEMQELIFDTFEEMNERCLARMVEETNLAAEVGTKLTAARTLPDAAELCQYWIARRMELLAQQGQQIVVDGQKFVQEAADVLSTGWRAGND
jgi:hypothetical protein